LGEVLEGLELAAQLQRKLQLINGPNKFRHPMQLPTTITPRAMAKANDGHGLGSEIGAKGVLVVPNEPADYLLNVDKQALGFLRDFWQLVGCHWVTSKIRNY
jgi:hypothetical protein